jgi:hypothetical protein
VSVAPSQFIGNFWEARQFVVESDPARAAFSVTPVAAGIAAGIA